MVSGTFERSRIVPDVSEVWWRHFGEAHCQRRCEVRRYARSLPHRQRKPSGQRQIAR